MEFYLATKKNEILSFRDKRMELESIILSEVNLRRSKIICSPSYVDYMWILLDMGHTLKGDGTWEGKGRGKKPKT
jgi:hypothetical protein